MRLWQPFKHTSNLTRLTTNREWVSVDCWSNNSFLSFLFLTLYACSSHGLTLLPRVLNQRFLYHCVVVYVGWLSFSCGVLILTSAWIIHHLVLLLSSVRIERLIMLTMVSWLLTLPRIARVVALYCGPHDHVHLSRTVTTASWLRRIHLVTSTSSRWRRHMQAK